MADQAHNAGGFAGALGGVPGFAGIPGAGECGRQRRFFRRGELRHDGLSRRAGRVQGAQANRGHFRIDRFHIAGARQGGCR